MKRLVHCTLVALLLGISFMLPASVEAQATYIVNSNADLPDASPGDGICATSTSVCTLRAAIAEANSDGTPTSEVRRTGKGSQPSPGCHPGDSRRAALVQYLPLVLKNH